MGGQPQSELRVPKAEDDEKIGFNKKEKWRERYNEQIYTENTLKIII